MVLLLCLVGVLHLFFERGASFISRGLGMAMAGADRMEGGKRTLHRVCTYNNIIYLELANVITLYILESFQIFTGTSFDGRF